MANKIVVGIKDRAITILVGNKNKIKCCKTFNLEKGWVVDGIILNHEEIVKILKSFLVKHRVFSKKVYVVIEEQDVITRFADLPVDEKSLRRNVQWEFKQYITDIDEKYYMDYEILEEYKNEEIKGFRVLMVAVSKGKIDSILKVIEELKLNLISIDTMANSRARVIKLNKEMKEIELLGLLSIDLNYSTLFIFQKGILKLQRQIPFGASNILKEISDKEKIDLEILQGSYETIIRDNGIKELYSEYENINEAMDGFLSSLSRIVDFYNTGKVKKDFDQLVVCAQEKIFLGVDVVISNYFGCEAKFVKDLNDLGINIKNEEKYRLDDFIPLYGILLRRD